MNKFLRELMSALMAIVISYTSMLAPLHAAIATLADKPIGSSGTNNVPANVLLTPSVEFPTAISQAHIGAFASSTVFLGYFDSYKCYSYNAGLGYFVPVGWTNGVTASGGKPVRAGGMTCNSNWSGNYLNWATMQTIDTFRMVLTGGDRVVDTVTNTVVQKAYASNQGSISGNFEIKTISSGVGNVTPSAWSSLSVRIWNMGRLMRIGNNSTSVADSALSLGEVDMNVAVQLCVKDLDPTLKITMLEDNCTQYGTSPNDNYKPEGLIQQNATKMRFGMFSYLNDGNINRDGGVLRARMKSVGPQLIVPGSVNTVNPRTEWDPVTGVYYTNPDVLDILSWSIAGGVIINSGVINYLNKFGLSGSYKTYDNVGEMYYGALRYLRKMSNPIVTEYQNNLTATMVDQFPVYTAWDDPIQFKCQKNFTVGIGDINTHRDRNVPGGTNLSYEPTMPAQVASDTVDFNAATNTLGLFEGMGSNLGGTLTGSSQASYYIAGLASWAHTNDIRPDLDDKQTVDFYWVDVMEGKVYKDKNQYWLAAKYGGYLDANSTGTPDQLTEWASTGQTIAYGGTTYKLPDNYFAASNPKAMADGLNKTFAQIGSRIARNSGVGVSSANVTTTGVEGYLPSYDPQYWIGDLKGSIVSADSSGIISNVTKFSSQAQLETQASGSGWSNARTIATGWGAGSAFAALPFRSGSMSAGQLAVLNSDSTTAKGLVDYLRGDRSKEGTTYRTRKFLLGTIVGSDPVVVKNSNAPYDDGANPGYSAFKLTNTTRAPVVLVGANDGMLHAFDGNTASAGGGKELWAYVPREMFATDAKFTSNGLVNFASPSYSHRYLVNGQIRLQDVDFSNASDGSTAATGVGGSWRTIAITGLGKGGKSYTAIDVSNPSAMNTDSALTGKVLWEFTDPKMGYTYGLPRIFKTKRYGWVAALPSGYNNADGQGYVFLVDPKTGALRATLTTGEGSALDPIGLAHVGGYIPDLTDYTADMLYGGDLKGNVWRWDLAAGTVAGVKIAQLKDSAGVGLPITTEPEIQSKPGSQERYVFFGTGRFLDETDTIVSQAQSLFGIRDGSRYTPWTAATLPAGLSYPFTKSSLQSVTNLTNGIVYDPTKGGWFYDMTFGLNGANERVVINPVAFGGDIVFASLIPSSDPCAPTGTSNLYSLSFTGGRSLLSVPYISLPQAAVKLTLVGASSKVSVVATLTASAQTASSGKDFRCSGDLCQIDLRSIIPSAMTRLNIREVRPDS